MASFTACRLRDSRTQGAQFQSQCETACVCVCIREKGEGREVWEYNGVQYHQYEYTSCS